MPIAALLFAALAAATIVGLLAWRYPHSAPGATTEPVVSSVVHAAEHSSRLRHWLRARRDPQAATGLALSIGAAVVVAAGATIGVLAYLVRGNELLRRVDQRAAQWGHDHASGFTNSVIEGITQLGDTWAVIALSVLVVAAMWHAGRGPTSAVFLAVVILGNKAITNAVKYLADRARPTLNPIAETLGPSFPSGHSSTAASFFAAAALVIGIGVSARGRAWIAAVAAGVAVGVAASRVLLDVHWLSDVIAGLALGWGWFALCAIAFGGRRLRFGLTARRMRQQVEAHSALQTPRD